MAGRRERLRAFACRDRPTWLNRRQGPRIPPDEKQARNQHQQHLRRPNSRKTCRRIGGHARTGEGALHPQEIEAVGQLGQPDQNGRRRPAQQQLVGPRKSDPGRQTANQPNSRQGRGRDQDETRCRAKIRPNDNESKERHVTHLPSRTAPQGSVTDRWSHDSRRRLAGRDLHC